MGCAVGWDDWLHTIHANKHTHFERPTPNPENATPPIKRDKEFSRDIASARRRVGSFLRFIASSQLPTESKQAVKMDYVMR